jgi:hypothetical protein
MTGKGNMNLKSISRQIKALEKSTVNNVVKIGGLLNEAYETLEHGEYQEWLSREFSWSYRTALRYLRVYLFAESCQIGTFKKMNLSLTALHLVADPCTNEKARKAIIRAALKGRVTYSIAESIIAKYSPADDTPDAPPIEPLPDEGGKGDDDDDDDDDDEAPPHSDDSKKQHLNSKLAETIREMQGVSATDAAWPDIIADNGTAALRKIIRTLQAVLDAYRDDTSSVKAAADRAEDTTARRQIAP